MSANNLLLITKGLLPFGLSGGAAFCDDERSPWFRELLLCERGDIYYLERIKTTPQHSSYHINGQFIE